MKHSYPLASALTLALGLAAATAARAQNVGIGTTTPNAAAALDITAAGKGLLIPRLDSATRAAIASPPAGLMVYQTAPRAGFYYYTGTAWVFIPDKARAGDNLGNHLATQNLNLNGNLLVGGTAASPGTSGLSVAANGYVGIGTAAPGAPLDVNGSIWSRNTVRVDANDTNNGGLASNAALYFGTTGSYEGIASKRTAGGNRYGLDFYTNNTNRLAVTNAGLVGIGTTTPDRVLTVQAPGGSSELLSLRNNAGTTRWHYNLYGTGDGLNLAETGVADFRLFVQPGGNVGIGTNAPSALLDVNGGARLRGLTTAGVVTTAADGTLSSAAASTLGDNLGNHSATTDLALNSHNLLLKAPGDTYHALRYSSDYDGPLAYGYGGGALGYTSNGSTVTPVLRWTRDNNVSVDLAGTNNGNGPDLSFGGAGYGEGIGSARVNGSSNQYGLDLYTASTRRLSIGNDGTVSVGVAGTNTGTAPDLAFGGAGTGEGIGSPRSTGNPNQYGLDFYTGFNKRLSIANSGNVGVGTTAPASTLQVNGTFAVGVVMNLAGSSAGTKFSAYAASYLGLAPTTNNDYYLLPAANSCIGRVYYIRNNSQTNTAYLSTEQGYIYEGGRIPNNSGAYMLKASGVTKTIMAISDGQNWTVTNNGTDSGN